MLTVLRCLELGDVQYLQLHPQINITCTLNFHNVHAKLTICNLNNFYNFNLKLAEYKIVIVDYMKINRVNQDTEYKWNTLFVSPTSGNSPWLHAKSN